MNHSLKFKNVALSALLLSAIAAPVSANAADTGSKKQVTNSAVLTNAPSEKGSAFSAVLLSQPNPLELARKYAPDTVSDWEKTLDQYKKASGITLNGSAAPGTLSATVVAVPAKDQDNLKQAIKNAKPGTLVKAEPLKAGGKITDTGVAATTAEGKNLSEASIEIPALFKSEIALAKAVEAKDSGDIQAALAKLLKEYKNQITVLETAKGNK